ncbi:MAG TPA: primosomal protein N', partial [Cytophagales bacterium]|nr:primosomal protein N' [Cytophagales bacterium]
VHDRAPKTYQAKLLIDIIDAEPLVTQLQLQFFKLLAQYYMCNEGDILSVALPTAMKLSSESKIYLLDGYADSPQNLSENEIEIIQILNSHKELSYTDLSKHTADIKIHKTLRALLQKNIIGIEEELKEKYKPKKIVKVKLQENYLNKDKINLLLNTHQSKPAQSNVLLTYITHTSILQDFRNNAMGIPKAELSKVSASGLNTLVKNRVFVEYEEEISRVKLSSTADIQGIPTLSQAQSQAYEEIKAHFQKQDTTLLYGITGSGKTEIYINLIDKFLQNESQVLYLLPEIALTTQIVERLRVCFGDRLGVYHSKFSENERVEVWTGLLSGRLQIIVGARSSIFLPFQNLGLIVIDEEHETSYKQHDPSPRYHARESALFLAKLHYAKTLLGSATPSIETFWLAKEGKFGLVTLTERFGGAQLPEVSFAKVSYGTKKDSPTPIGEVLLNALKQRLEKREQSILFLNRRGFSPLITCENCGWTPSCPRCNVSLTYHQYKNKLSCHYCGHFQEANPTCYACGSTKIKTIGFGTEMIEDELKLMLPDAQIRRMDLETTRSKNAFVQIIEEFASGQVDILVGTQMVTKGLDFDQVTLVGVIDVDKMLYFPDFRAFERTFHLVTQASGRAGRRNKKGEVIIQTHNPNHSFFKHLKEQKYEDFYEEEIAERARFHYPPFTRIIKLTVKNKDKELCHSTAKILFEELVTSLGHERIFGPATPSIDKIREYYLQEIVLKIERAHSDIVKMKGMVQLKCDEILLLKKSSVIHIDVDFV